MKVVVIPFNYLGVLLFEGCPMFLLFILLLIELWASLTFEKIGFCLFLGVLV